MTILGQAWPWGEVQEVVLTSNPSDNVERDLAGDIAWFGSSRWDRHSWVDVITGVLSGIPVWFVVASMLAFVLWMAWWLVGARRHFQLVRQFDVAALRRRPDDHRLGRSALLDSAAGPVGPR